MAIAVDASTPAIVGGNVASLQTPTFSPPAGSLLVACMHADPQRTFTITNTVASLTWNAILHLGPSGLGSVTARYASVPGGATNMSVTAAGSVTNDFGFKVWVVTGADLATPIGAVVTGGPDAANTLSKTLVPQAGSSLGFVVAEDFSAVAGTTSPDTTFAAYDVGGRIAGGSGYRVMGPASGSETFTVDAGGAAASEWVWGLFEVRAAAVTAPPTVSAFTPPRARFRAANW